MSAQTVAARAPARVELAADGLLHRYGGRRGLEPVSFSWESPAVVAVTGANGAGKSTLLRILVGLLRPSGGRSQLRLDGTEIAPAARREVMGFASPELSFYDEFSAMENLEFAAESRGLTEPRTAAASVLGRVGLLERAADRVATLSSGMRQRLRIAFALLHEPEVLLLDEPGSHLDPEGREVLERLIADHGRFGLVVVATNEPGEWKLAEQRIELRGRGLGGPA